MAKSFWLAGVFLVLAVPSGQAAGPTVRTTGGAVQGISTAYGKEYLGIPYAAPPLGALRWKAPRPASWSGVLDADTPPPACPQAVQASGLTPSGGTANVSEDCLFLNVYAPSGAARLPVMLWLHGGGNEVGTGSTYDGSALVRNGVIVVTINYRLGLLGFLADPALDAESPLQASGDYGLMDQQAALRWVRQNIASFGGDPSNVTVFGQGAGGQDIVDQLASPGATGMFERAIVESGGYGVQLPTLPGADSQGQSFANSVGCTSTTDASCLRALPLQKLLAGEAGPGSPYVTSNVLRFEPNVGTAILPIQPLFALAFGVLNRVPVIIGTNHDDARLFTAFQYDFAGGPLAASNYDAAIATVVGQQISQLVAGTYPLAAYPSPDVAFSSVFTDVGFACISRVTDQLLSSNVPTYTYEFADENASGLLLPADPFLSLGAPDTSELPFLWPNLVGSGGAPATTFTAPEQALSTEMLAAWTNFAKSGNPNGPGVTSWPSYSIASDRFHEFVPDATTNTTSFTSDHKCNFWEPLEIIKALTPAPAQ